MISTNPIIEHYSPIISVDASLFNLNIGGGGLRILPHKKWHVWRRDNIERVLRDEHENEEKLKDLDVKKRKLEQERRAQQLLRTDQAQERQHINFFEVERAQASSREVAKPQKKKENGSDETLRRHGKLPWYAQIEDAKKKELTVRQERKRKRELEMADPLHQMRPKEEREQRPLFVDRSTREDQRGYIGEDEADKVLNNRSKRREKKNKSKHKHKLGKGEALLHDLRRERQEREASERRRAERLMLG